MIASLFYVLLSVLGLSFLIFIHELGHYWMARRVGMRVETFAIGFGKPIYSWVRDGVNWQIGWLLFGGYVKIAGTESEGGTDPYSVKDGFFGKKPLDRIKVAFMGPFVNLVFAFLIFVLIWASGGREKNYADFTHKIGWIDPQSELYAAGLRPGDEITAYGEYPFQSAKDHLYAPLLAVGEVAVKGFKVDHQTGERSPFEYKVRPYPNPAFLDKSVLTVGILNPANYILYAPLGTGQENPLPEGSPLENSGIRYGDRIVWADGELIYSSAQLSHLLNDGRVLLTVERGDNVFLRRVPRVKADELRPDSEFKEELIDWQHEAGIKDRRFDEIYTIPYNLTYNCIVENVLRFIDKTEQEAAFPPHLYSEEEAPLQPGDRILAVQGVPVTHAFELIRELQNKRVNLVVLRNPELQQDVTWTDADAGFHRHVSLEDLAAIARSIGSKSRISQLDSLVLLPPVTPKKRTDFAMSEDAKAWLAMEKSERLKALEQIEDPDRRQRIIKLFQTNENLLVLGLPNPQDLKVIYNPEPIGLFESVFDEIWRTLSGLVSGSLSPKYIAGPVGIVQVVHSTSMVSFKEALFWIGAISLNLGILNLLPIPILDGGTIVFSFYELATGKRIKPKVLERITIVFAVLLVGFFLFLTYNDVLRVFGRFLG